MGRKRRLITVNDTSSWIFNRMAEVYDARPPYPPDLVDTLVTLATSVGRRVLDVGAGIGHLALPLAQRGLDVMAVEPASAMLDKMRASVATSSLSLQLSHATAEALPFDGPGFDLALIADALHFIDAELAAAELRRVLVPGGILAIVTCKYAQTPFMLDVEKLVALSSDRRPRDVGQAVRQLAALTEVRLDQEWTFHDETLVDSATLERILQSVSFIGPAMNADRFETLRRGLQALAHEPVWARTFSLRAGHRQSLHEQPAMHPMSGY